MVAAISVSAVEPNISRSNLMTNAMAATPAPPPVMVDLMHPAANVEVDPHPPIAPLTPAATGGSGSIDGPMAAAFPVQTNSSAGNQMAAGDTPPTNDPASQPNPRPIPQPAIPIDYNSKPVQPQPSANGRPIGPDQAPINPPVPPIPVQPPTPSSPSPQPRRGKGLLIAFIIIVALAVLGAAGYFLVYRNITKPTPKALTSVSANSTLSNFGLVSGQTTLPAGSSTNQATPTLSFKVNTTGNQGTVTPEVEVQPLNTPFTGSATAAGQPVSATGAALTLTVSMSKLADGPYHWQARIQVASGAGTWTPAGNDPTKPDFIINTTPPAKPSLLMIDGQKIDQSTKAGTINTAKPVLTGKTTPQTTIGIVISPENINLTATVDATGNWTATPTSSLPSGARDFTVTATDPAGNTSTEVYHLVINAPVATSATPQPTPSATPTPTPTPTPTATPTPTPSATPVPTPSTSPVATSLAPTGDPVQLINLVCLGLLLLSGLAWIWLRHVRSI